ncbi:MAG: hypothetical protein MUF01_16370 [Bryobacterales bacterium]|jgi:protein-tyrosine phosphatase|nr:hypothetical protein [Bryobacterales bacterium]
MKRAADRLCAACPRRLGIGIAYAAIGGLLLVVGWLGNGWLVVALWPALACAMVSASYLAGNGALIVRRPGWAFLPRRLALAPWMLATYANAWLWTHAEPPAVEVCPGIWLGKSLSGHGCQRLGIRSVVSMAAERGCPPGLAFCRHIPVLDLTIPTPAQLQHAVDAIDGSRDARPTLVCCALGYSRSALAMAAWLLASNAIAHPDAAILRLRQGPRRIVLSQADRLALWRWQFERSA